MLWFDDLVDAVKKRMRVIEGLYDGVSTSELDNLAAETAASIGASDYAQLAAKCDFKFAFELTKSFSETMTEMFEYVNQETDNTLH
jgi:ribonucleoside-diphosphate reductase alpha chain